MENEIELYEWLEQNFYNPYASGEMDRDEDDDFDYDADWRCEDAFLDSHYEDQYEDMNSCWD
jgi:hypothetical protein